MAQMTAADLVEAFDCSTDAADLPEAMCEMMSFIHDNTGLLGEYTPGDATVKIGGKKIEVWGERDVLGGDYSITSWVNEHDDLEIHRPGLMKSMGYHDHSPSGGTFPSLIIKVTEE